MFLHTSNLSRSLKNKSQYTLEVFWWKSGRTKQPTSSKKQNLKKKGKKSRRETLTFDNKVLQATYCMYERS